jgi:glutaminase
VTRHQPPAMPAGDTGPATAWPERYVSTGQLPAVDRVQALVDEAHDRFGPDTDGEVPTVYPALAAAPARWVGVNATGLRFNSLAAIEQGSGGLTNPMVNPGAIATAGLVPGRTSSGPGCSMTTAGSRTRMPSSTSTPGRAA